MDGTPPSEACMAGLQVFTEGFVRRQVMSTFADRVGSTSTTSWFSRSTRMPSVCKHVRLV